MKKLRITKIRIVGNKDFPCDILVDNIAVFRMRTAFTFKTNAKNVMFTYYDGENKIDELNKEALK